MKLKPIAMHTAMAIMTLLASLPAGAVEFNTVQADKSALVFGFKQMGVPGDGRFRKFTTQMSFDPARPEAARASIEIDLASIDTGSTEVNGEVLGRQWFNVKTYPTARFVSSRVRALGGNRYELAGQLSLKGRSQALAIPVTFQPQGNVGVFDGSFVIKRADFAIGEGAWMDFSAVANEVQVRFRIVATATAAK